MLGKKRNRSSKFRTKSWVEGNDESPGTYNTKSQIKFKTSMLKSSLFDYNDGYVLVSATTTVPNIAAAGAVANNRKNIIIKSCASFTNCINE